MSKSLRSRTKILLSLLVLIMSAPAAKSQPVQFSKAKLDEVVKLDNQAVKLIGTGDLSGASKKLKQALEILPDFKLAKENLAIVQKQLGIHNDAHATQKQTLPAGEKKVRSTDAWYLGQWRTEPQSDLAPQAKHSERHFYKRGTLIINRDGSYVWRTFATMINGRWRTASDEELNTDKIDSAIVLTAAKAGKDWIVHGNKNKPGSITVFELGVPEHQEVGER